MLQNRVRNIERQVGFLITEITSCLLLLAKSNDTINPSSHDDEKAQRDEDKSTS